VSAYLTKPIDLDDLVYKVQEVLEKNGADRDEE